MVRKGNECHTINNTIFLNKSHADKSRKSHNERFTLSKANLERLSFPLALTQTLQVLASSCLPQQIFNFFFKSPNLLQKNSQRIRFRCPNPQEILAKLQTHS